MHAWRAFRSVSYTHLDVYKRQAFFQKGEDQLSVAKADEVAKRGDSLVSALQKDALRLRRGLNSKVFAGGILFLSLIHI